MISFFKAALKATPLYRLYLALKPKLDYDPFDYDFKRAVISEYADAYSCSTLVETGTCEGGTIAALHGHFDRIISIELDEVLAERARRKFSEYGHISILQGDSELLLPGILRDLTARSIFWLDAHYSGEFRNCAGELIKTARAQSDTPLQREVEIILADNRHQHIILIDDARELGKGDYPKRRVLRRMARRASPPRQFVVEKDIARIADIRSH